MTRRVRFSDLAESRLNDIVEWTEERFGPHQADRYRLDLLNRVQRLAQDTIPAQSCRALWHSDLPADMMFIRAGRHFIIFSRRGERRNARDHR